MYLNILEYDKYHLSCIFMCTNVRIREVIRPVHMQYLIILLDKCIADNSKNILKYAVVTSLGYGLIHMHY